MKAIVFENNTTQIKNIPKPCLIDSYDVIVEVKCVGICKTDLLLSNGLISCKDGQVLGHEFSGIIFDKGDKVSNINIGDKVSINPLIDCLECENCLEKKSCISPLIKGIHSDGALTNLVLIPSKNIYKVSDEISFEIAAYLEPVAAAMSILNMTFPKDSRVLVFGSGRITKLSNFILEKFGYTNVFSTNDINDINEKFDVIIENGIDSSLFNKLLEKLKFRGLFILKSRHLSNINFIGSEIVKNEITIRGVNYSNFDDAFNFLINNKEYFKNFIGNSFLFENYKNAFEFAQKEENYKHFIDI
ncbi:MAG: alcohol dehydrogenase catalytic domain-containing protein [Candidatus Sericytochromatia bacterium]